MPNASRTNDEEEDAAFEGSVAAAEEGTRAGARGARTIAPAARTTRASHRSLERRALLRPLRTVAPPPDAPRGTGTEDPDPDSEGRRLGEPDGAGTGKRKDATRQQIARIVLKRQSIHHSSSHDHASKHDQSIILTASASSPAGEQTAIGTLMVHGDVALISPSATHTTCDTHSFATEGSFSSFGYSTHSDNGEGCGGDSDDSRLLGASISFDAAPLGTKQASNGIGNEDGDAGDAGDDRNDAEAAPAPYPTDLNGDANNANDEDGDAGDAGDDRTDAEAAPAPHPTDVNGDANNANDARGNEPIPSELSSSSPEPSSVASSSAAFSERQRVTLPKGAVRSPPASAAASTTEVPQNPFAGLLALRDRDVPSRTTRQRSSSDENSPRRRSKSSGPNDACAEHEAISSWTDDRAVSNGRNSSPMTTITTEGNVHAEGVSEVTPCIQATTNPALFRTAESASNPFADLLALRHRDVMLRMIQQQSFSDESSPCHCSKSSGPNDTCAEHEAISSRSDNGGASNRGKSLPMTTIATEENMNSEGGSKVTPCSKATTNPALFQTDCQSMPSSYNGIFPPLTVNKQKQDGCDQGNKNKKQPLKPEENTAFFFGGHPMTNQPIPPIQDNAEKEELHSPNAHDPGPQEQQRARPLFTFRTENIETNYSERLNLPPPKVKCMAVNNEEEFSCDRPTSCGVERALQATADVCSEDTLSRIEGGGHLARYSAVQSVNDGDDTNNNINKYDPNTYSQLHLLGLNIADDNQLQADVKARTCRQGQQELVGNEELLAQQWNKDCFMEIVFVLLVALSFVGLVVVLVVVSRA